MKTNNNSSHHYARDERRGWLTVCGGTLIQLVLGTLYLWTNITGAVTSHLRSFDSSIEYSDTLIVYGIAIGFQGIFMILGGILANLIGTRLCCFIGGYLFVFAIFLASISKSLETFIASYGIMFGMGLGLLYTATISVSCKWLPDHKGLVTGIIVSGFGLGSFIFGFIAIYIVNPSHELVIDDPNNSNFGYYPPESIVSKNVPKMFQMLATIYFILITIGCILITDPPNPTATESISDQPHLNLFKRSVIHKNTFIYHPACSNDVEDNIDKESINENDINRSGSNEMIVLKASLSHNNNHEIIEEQDDILDNSMIDSNTINQTTNNGSENNLIIQQTPSDIIKNPLAWHLAICLASTTVGGMYVIGTFKTFGQMRLKDEEFLSTVASIASIFNACGRIVWGAIADRIGPMYAILLMSFNFAWLLYFYTFSANFGKFGFMIWTFLIFLFEGGNFVLYVPLVVQLFGSLHAGSNYGMIFAFYTLFVVINIAVVSESEIDFTLASKLMGVLTLIGFFNALLLDRHIKIVTKRGYLRLK
eukprot:gene4855-6805_t